VQDLSDGVIEPLKVRIAGNVRSRFWFHPRIVHRLGSDRPSWLMLPPLPPLGVLPDGGISASILVCEKIMKETDGVSSAIRIVDLFFVPEMPELPPTIRGMIDFQLHIAIRADPTDTTKHRVGLKIIDPTGKIDPIGQDVEEEFTSRHGDDVPKGITVNATVHFQVKHMGTHCISLVLDGVHVARVPFTLARPPSTQSPSVR
jgi:hypothetical protein